jgi:tetratricopeptide (TPR) repeat protein
MKTNRLTLAVIAVIVLAVVIVALSIIGPRRRAQNQQRSLIANATLALNRGEYQQAYELYKQFLTRMPDNPGVMLRIGEVCVQLKRFDEARTWFDKAGNLIPNESYPRVLKASTYRHEASHLVSKLDDQSGPAEFDRIDRVCDDGERLLNEAGKTTGASPIIQGEKGQLWTVRADVARHRARFHQRLTDDAQATHKTKEAAAQQTLADQWSNKVDQDMDNAVKELSSAYKLSPKDMGLAEAYAQAAFRAEKWDEATIAYRTASTVARPPARLAVIAAQAYRAAAKGKTAATQRQHRQLSIEALDTAVKNNPYNPDIKLELASVELDAGALDTAEQLINKVLTMGRRKSDAAILQARLLLLRNKPTEARDQLRSLDAAEPNRPAIKVLLAEAEGRCGNADRCLDLLQQAVRLDQDNAENRVRAAAALAGRGMPDKAEALLQKGLGRDPSNMELVSAAASTAVRYERPDRLKAIIEGAERSAASRPQVLVDLALFSLRLGRPEWAKRVAAEVIKTDPKSMISLVVSGAAGLAQGKAAEALESVKPLLSQKNLSPEVSLTLAQILGSQGRLSEADAQVLQAMVAGQYDFLIVYRAAQVYAELGMLDRASKANEWLQAEDPESPATVRQAGDLAIRRGELPDASESVCRLTVLGAIGKTALTRAVADLLTGRYEQGLATLQGQTDVTARCVAHWCLADLGRQDAALGELEKAIRAHPGQLPLYLRLAEYAAAAGKSGAGIDALTRCAEVNRPYAALGIGRVHFLSGAYDRAISTYRAALKDKTLKIDKHVDGQLRLSIAACLGRQGKTAEQMAVYREMEKDPATALAGLEADLDLLIRMRQFKDVGQALDQLGGATGGLSLAPEHLRQMAVVYRRIGQVEKSAEMYDRIARQLPDSIAAARMKADLYRSVGQTDRLIEVVHQSLGKWPGFRVLLLDLASAYAQAGCVPEAFQSLTSIAAPGGTPPLPVLRQKALLLARLGLCQAARTALEQYLSRPGIIDFQARLALGRCLADLNSVDPAMKELSAIPSTSGEYGQARALMARLEQDRGRVKEATAILAEGVNRAADNETLAWTFFQAALGSNQLDEAIRLASRWAATTGNAANWSLAQADAVLRKGDLGAAIAVLETALKANPDNHPLAVRLAAYLLQRGDTAGIRRTLKPPALATASAPATTQAAPSPGPAVDCLLSLADLAEGMDQAAAKRLDDLLKRATLASEWRAVAAMARMAAGTAASVESLAKGITSDGDRAILQSMSEVVAKPEGRKLCRWTAASVLARQLGLWALSSTIAGAAVDADKNSVIGYVAQLDALASVGAPERDRIKKLQDDVVQRFAATLLARRLAIQIACERGQLDRAVSLLKSWQPASDIPSDLLYGVGSATLTKNRREEALQWFEQCLKRNPRNVEAANNVAYLLIELRGQDPASVARAVKLAEESTQQSGGQPAAADTLGWVWVKAGRTKEGLALLQQVILTLPDDLRVHYHVGCAYAAVGQVEMARLHLQHVTASAKDPTLAEEARKALGRLAESAPGSRPVTPTTTRSAA